jgi:ribosome maturation factor RimP
MGAQRPFFVKATAMADLHTKEKALEREISQTVERDLPGTEVLAVELLSPARFCVYVDHPQGVDHALCERVSGLLRPYLDRYAVDVSSPGLERPLRKPAHFRNVVGRKVALRTAGEIAGHKRFRGEVLAAGDRAVRVAAGETELDIPYEAIVRGNLIDEGQ